MKENESQFENVILPLSQALHFYLSMILGWWFFHREVYSAVSLAKGSSFDLAAQLPVYAINVMAFGCLVYVATRPVTTFLLEVARTAKRAMESYRNR